MILHILRALFVLLMASVGFLYVYQNPPSRGASFLEYWIPPAVAMVVAVALVCIDILSPRKKLAIFSGTFFGLVVGLLIAYVMSFLVRLIVTQYGTGDIEKNIQGINMIVAVATCYLAISFILQTKDHFRFVIPYVEFSKQTKGERPMLLDTSVLIDGRCNDIAASGILESQLIVPRFVLNELQQVADSADKLKRNRGRRGLDILAKLQANKRAEVIMYDSSARSEAGVSEVDQLLMHLAKD